MQEKAKADAERSFQAVLSRHIADVRTEYEAKLKAASSAKASSPKSEGEPACVTGLGRTLSVSVSGPRPA